MGSKTDNFHNQHFQRNLPEYVVQDVNDVENWQLSTNQWPQLGEVKIKVPIVNHQVIEKKPRLLLDNNDNDEELPPIGFIPEITSKASDALSTCCIENSLINNINTKKFSALQSEILTVLSHYVDFNYTEVAYDKQDKIRMVYSLHALNHLLKSMKIIRENNKTLENSEDEEIRYNLRDQGFTRPKVLILLPFKNSAYKLLKMMMKLYGGEVKNKNRFLTEFGPPEKKSEGNKPKDFYEVFEGDISEDFRIGISLTKKSLKLYTDFIESDMIVASPLALRYTLENAEGVSKHFLSSVEVFIMDQADIFLMQNWHHVLYIQEALNKMPNNLQALNFDIYRIRRWYYNDLSQYYRQTVLFGAANSAVFLAYMEGRKNFAGRIIVANPFQSILSDLDVRAELVLQRVKNDPSCETYSSEAQFLHFKNNVLPLLRKKNLSHVMIYIPDYFDYIQLISYFKDDGGISVSTVNEYMIEEKSKVAKARSLFFEGKRPFLLYTERYHFYTRAKIKGVRHIVFYSPPTYSHFFSEICGFLSEEYQNRRENFEECSSIWLPYQVPHDIIPLSRILGRDKAEEVFLSDKQIHLCFTGVS